MLKERISDDMKAALRAGDKERLSTIRMILAAVKRHLKRLSREGMRAPR